MLSDHCLSCLSVCNVGVLWPNGLTDPDETWHAGRPRPICPAYVSHQLQGNLLIKHKKEYISCSAVLSEDIANIIIRLHVITGSDHTSAFFSHGKKKVLQKVISDPEAMELLQQVRERLELRDEVKAAMKTFVLLTMYSENAHVTCVQARASRWHKMKKKAQSASLLMTDTLNHHLERINYITYCQMHYDLLEHPSPIGHDWEFMNGKCRPVCHTQPPLPHEVIPRECIDDNSEGSSSDDNSEISDSTDSDE